MSKIKIKKSLGYFINPHGARAIITEYLIIDGGLYCSLEHYLAKMKSQIAYDLWLEMNELTST